MPGFKRNFVLPFRIAVVTYFYAAEHPRLLALLKVIISKDGICLVEWSENIEYALPEQYLSVKIEKCDSTEDNADTRKLSVNLIKK